MRLKPNGKLSMLSYLLRNIMKVYDKCVVQKNKTKEQTIPLVVSSPGQHSVAVDLDAASNAKE